MADLMETLAGDLLSGEGVQLHRGPRVLLGLLAFAAAVQLRSRPQRKALTR